jgi:acyl dehydratase
MSGPARLWFEDVAAGDALPTIEFDVTLTSLVMYAGATWDFHRYHYDAAYVAERGHRAPFMDGQMVGALLTRQLMQWGGTDAFVRRLAFRLRTMVYADDRISISGRVTGVVVEAGRGLALCTMDIDVIDGGAVVREATAAVELGRRLARPG